MSQETTVNTTTGEKKHIVISVFREKIGIAFSDHFPQGYLENEGLGSDIDGQSKQC
jgi:hypothetical protein